MIGKESGEGQWKNGDRPWTGRSKIKSRYYSRVNYAVHVRRRLGSVVRVGDLNAGDPGSNPQLRLLNEFFLGDPRGKFTTLCK